MHRWEEGEERSSRCQRKFSKREDEVNYESKEKMSHDIIKPLSAGLTRLPFLRLFPLKLFDFLKLIF